MTTQAPDFRPRILMVEDHWLVAMEAARMLGETGCEVVGPYATVRDAAPHARDADLDAAILDVNLGDETSLPVAEILKGRGIPFALATGYHASQVPSDFQAVLCLDKPVDNAMVKRFLVSIGLAQAQSGFWNRVA